MVSALAVPSADGLDPTKIVSVDLGSSAFKQDARRQMSIWAQNPPFYVLADGPVQVVVGRWADVHEVFTSPDRFSSELPRGKPGFEQYDKFMGMRFVTQMDGAQHLRIRRLLMPAFAPKRLTQIETRITEIIDGLLDDIEAKGPDFDGMRDLGAHLVVEALLTAMVNLDPEQKQAFTDFHDVLPGTTYTRPGEPFPPECQAAFEKTGAMVKAMIADRRTSKKSDFIDDLVGATEDGDRLTDKELFDQLFTLLGGSLSATSRAAGGALLTLYQHPDQVKQLIADPALISGAVEECLRIASNGYFTFPRLATCDTEVGGTEIRKGMIVRPSPQAGNYDPGVFADPMRFDIHRNPKRITAFGAGPHHCIGNVLGRMAIATAIKRLLARFPAAHLVDPDFEPTYGGAVGELRLQSLPMRTHLALEAGATLRGEIAQQEQRAEAEDNQRGGKFDAAQEE